eukprot:6214797-Pleurochrysis_carterae.AAC.1
MVRAGRAERGLAPDRTAQRASGSATVINVGTAGLKRAPRERVLHNPCMRSAAALMPSASTALRQSWSRALERVKWGSEWRRVYQDGSPC